MRPLTQTVTVLFLVLVLSAGLSGHVLAQPPVMRLYGSVRVNNDTVDDGTEVTAHIRGDTYSTTTSALYGPSTYALKIAPESGTPYPEGTPITFRIGDLEAHETASWVTGYNVKFNLTAHKPVATPTPTPPNGPIPTIVPTAPTACIDAIYPNLAEQRESVMFSGHGNDPDGEVVGFIWSSDKEGTLSGATSFVASALSVGIHTISFQVEDDDGLWSKEVTGSVTITPLDDKQADGGINWPLVIGTAAGAIGALAAVASVVIQARKRRASH